jgi:hypothetical protein
VFVPGLCPRREIPAFVLSAPGARIELLQELLILGGLNQDMPPELKKAAVHIHHIRCIKASGNVLPEAELFQLLELSVK